MNTFPVFILVLLVSLVSSFEFPLSQTFNLNSTLGTKIFTFQSNLKNTATFSLETTADLVFCFQIQLSLADTNTSIPVLSNNSAYWNASTCSYFLSTTGNHSAQIAFEIVPYAVGIFFKNATGIVDAPEVRLTIGVAGETCPLDQISLPSGECVAVAKVETGTYHAAPGWTAYRFVLSEKNLTGQFSIGCDTGSELDFWVARDASPAHSATKYTCAEGAKFPTPRTGVYGWYILVNNSLAPYQNFTITEELCPQDMGGVGCGIHVRNASFTPKIELIMDETYYFQINATTGPGGVAVWVSARGVNGSAVGLDVVNPIIFASLNQLPTLDNADIGGCTQQYCDYVTSIAFNVTANQTWYIGVRNLDKKFNGSLAGVWFNDLCAPDCIDHGNCQTAGPAAGYCQCIDGFIGVDCGTQNGFGPQFIVLIIIAVLVALTAVIGFGAWAYMRRKRGQYDIVQ